MNEALALINMLTYTDFEKSSVRTMQLAIQTALRLNHDSIRPEHILIGLCRNKPPSVVKALRHMGVTFEQIANAVFSHIEPGSATFMQGKLLPQQTAKQVTEHATQVASNLGATEVGDEHLLLGLIFVEGTIASDALSAVGIEYNNVLLQVKTT